MDNFEKQLKKESQNVLLAESEKSKIRLHLQEEIKRDYEKNQKQWSAFSWKIFAHHAVLVSGLILIIIGGATSAFAESALPGDFLYKFKLGVNEQVLGLFARSPQSKAEWHLTVAERRIKEIEYLNEIPNAPEDVVQTVRKNLDEQTKYFNDPISEEAENTEATSAKIATFSSEKYEQNLVVASTTVESAQVSQETQIERIKEKVRNLQGSILNVPENDRRLRLREQLILTKKNLIDSREGVDTGKEHEVSQTLREAQKRVSEIERELTDSVNQ